MHIRGVIWLLGVLSLFYGGSMLLPTLVALINASGEFYHFLFAACLTLLTGLLSVRYIGEQPQHLTHRDGFLIVALAWLTLSLLGAIPFLSIGVCESVVDALFESASGLTTTGATVLSGLDTMPHAILLWRSMQEWLGGMGIIVLAVAIMPLLGVGGMQLFRAETPGPVKDKLTARVTETAKVLWYIYLLMTVICAAAYALAGMNWFDAINHAMCTVAIGGFSTHDASMGWFHSTLIEMIAVFFMVLAGINFTLHFAVLNNRFSPQAYWKDEEFRAYIYILGVVFVVIAVPVWWSDSDDLHHVLFNVVSVATTTGFAVSDYSQWPPGTNMLLFVVMFIGACAGSTGGGMKVIRVLLLFRQGLGEIRRMIHPHAVIYTKLGEQTVEANVVQAVWGFFVLYMVCYLMIAVIVAMTGVDLLTAMSATAACLTNTGPGFGHVGPADNYAALPAAGKSVLMFAMILGRLEIYTFFVLLVPEFWRK